MRRYLTIATGAVAIGAFLAGPGIASAQTGATQPGATAVRAGTVSRQDAKFIKQNGQTNLAEISLGKVAEKRAVRARTRHLAATLIRNHQQVEAKLRKLAARTGVPVPTAPSAMQRQAAKVVEAQHGIAFDKVYTATEIAGHEVSIVQTHAEISLGSSRAVRRFARYYLPFAQMHLKMAVADHTALTGTTRPAAGHRTSTATASGGVSEIPISFRVRNVDHSKVSCPTDKRRYTVRGDLVTPTRSLAASSHPRAVTLYLHGLGLGEFFWNLSSFSKIHGFNFARSMAKRGHTSVIVDRLGYGQSDKPPGGDICFGSQADIAHQEIQDLRHGHYTLGAGHQARSYRKVVLAGHSVGGLITQIEAYSFHDASAYVSMSWSDTGMSKLEKADASQWTLACALGGAHVTGSTGPTGYAPYATPAMTPATFFRHADPAVVRYALAQKVRDPCGDASSILAGIAADEAYLGQIRQPVLVLFGTKDALFPPPDGPRQAARFTGSSSVTYKQIKGDSHAITLEPQRAQVVRDLSSWLDRHVGRG